MLLWTSHLVASQLTIPILHDLIRGTQKESEPLLAPFFYCKCEKKDRLLLVFRRKALLLPRNQNENTKHRELMKSFNYAYYFFFYFYFSHKVEREFVCVK